jgi:hypothetical protein
VCFETCCMSQVLGTNLKLKAGSRNSTFIGLSDSIEKSLAIFDATEVNLQQKLLI